MYSQLLSAKISVDELTQSLRGDVQAESTAAGLPTASPKTIGQNKRQPMSGKNRKGTQETQLIPFSPPTPSPSPPMDIKFSRPITIELPSAKEKLAWNLSPVSPNSEIGLRGILEEENAETVDPLGNYFSRRRMEATDPKQKSRKLFLW